MALSDLSRAVSHALRHEPWLYELELDEAGWVSMTSLVEVLRTELASAKDDLTKFRDNLDRTAKQRYEALLEKAKKKKP